MCCPMIFFLLAACMSSTKQAIHPTHASPFIRIHSTLVSSDLRYSVCPPLAAGFTEHGSYDPGATDRAQTKSGSAISWKCSIPSQKTRAALGARAASLPADRPRAALVQAPAPPPRRFPHDPSPCGTAVRDFPERGTVGAARGRLLVPHKRKSAAGSSSASASAGSAEARGKAPRAGRLGQPGLAGP